MGLSRCGQTGFLCHFTQGFPGGSDSKEESACNAGDWVQFLGWEVPWRREWLPTPAFLPGEFHGQRNLAGYSPWDSKELDTTEQLTRTHHPGHVQLGEGGMVS